MPVRVGDVRSETVSDAYAATGSLRATQRSAVAAEEEGRVLTVAFDVGETVEDGDVLATIDARRLEAELATMQARLAESRAEVIERQAMSKLAEIALKRLEPLRETGAASDEEYDTAVANLDAGQARREAADAMVRSMESNLELMAVRLEDTQIKAPFAGRVVERHVDPGARLAAGDPVLTIVSTGTIEAWLDLPERLAHALPASLFEDSADAARLLRLTIDGQEITPRRVRRVGEVGQRVRTLKIVADLDDRDGQLLPGMSVRALVPTGEETEQLTVPRGAVLRGGGETMSLVYVVREGAAAPMPVEVTAAAGDRLAVRSAQLREGDQVVTEGAERLMPGMPVTVVE